ncbi:MAG: ribosomal RNA small subunit methyltransferase A [Verrucomicrobiota bacterium]|nr:ribosomal RNA small subunit methyltransferase A [Verrucomicrobiota bacterium]
MRTLSELLPFLNQLGRRPNRALSQSFLVDPNIVRKIVDLAVVRDGDSVFEIGPGAGALTSELMQRGAKLIAVEKDPVLAVALQARGVRLFSCDILDFDWQMLHSQAPFKVVANLPYHITTPILELLLQHKSLFSSFTIMVQEEVALRMMARPGSSDYGALSLFMQFHTELIDSFLVSPSCFYPRPKIFSRVLHFLPKKSPLSEAALSTIRRTFQTRRKMLRTSLKDLLSQEEIEKGLLAAGASPQARPEELSLEQWCEFFS